MTFARAGTSSGGGGGGGDATPPSPTRPPLVPPPTPLSREPRVLSTSPPPLQPPRAPPRAADRDTEEAEYNYGHLEEGELEDDVDSVDDQDRGENLRGSSDSKFFSTLYMSDRINVPDDIIRNGFVPLNKHEYFSWHQTWSLVLGRYRSYLRPPKDHRVFNGGFRRPYDYPRALGFQEPILDLILESSNNYIIQEKIKILSKQYGLFRRTWSLGSCFYTALLFSYLENLGQMQDRQAEVVRLMDCMEISIQRFYQLEWEEAYFLNPEDYFLCVVDEFNDLVNSVANGLTSDKLHEKSLEEISSGRSKDVNPCCDVLFVCL